MELADVQQWIDRYVQAWRSNDSAAVGELFSDDARYFTTPFRPAKEGRPAILEWWLREPDEPGSWEATYEAVAVTGDLGVVRGRTNYRSGEEYHNVFLIRFDRDGRASEFTEYWMLTPATGESE
jgi:uncharacterized protein (TIGR02246 family)